MTKTEFQSFATAGAIESVVVSWPHGADHFELWVHVPGYRGNERFHTARGNVKEWTDLATVYREIRAMRWDGPIVVEG